MAKAKAILKRRRSVRNTAKITRTMQMIATSKFKKAQSRVAGAQPYAEKLAELASSLFSAAGGEFSHPLLEPRGDVKRVGLMVLSSNQGLCGGYNANLIRLARDTRQRLHDDGNEVELHVVGKKAAQYFRFMKTPIARQYLDLSDKAPFAEIEAIADAFIRDFAARRLGSVWLVYTRFVSVARQTPVAEQLIPLSLDRGDETGAPAREAGYLFEPDAASILNEVLPLSIQFNLYRAFIEAIASEQVARMVAMKGATDNADKLIKSLTRLYNRARQTQITTELSEIVGGAVAV